MSNPTSVPAAGRAGKPLQILLDPGTYDFANLGGVALLQVAVRRLCGLWPQAAVQVLTRQPEEFPRHCPEATPLSVSGHRSFLGDRLLGRAHRWMPSGLDGAVSRMDDALRERWPDARERVVRLKLGLQRRSASDLDAFCEAIESADLVVASGLTGIRGSEIHALETLDLAIYREKPTAMFSLGLSGSHSPELERRMRRVLPRVDLIALRERRTAPRVLRRLGVEAPDFVITGDDAVELAYEARLSEPGSAIGVNLRFGSSELDEVVVDDVRAALVVAATQYGTRLVPLPTGRDTAHPDREVIERALGGLSAPTRMPSLDTPLAVVQEISRCRVVVSAAYHAAVFALAQGIPAVCVAKSDYYTDKLTCLADLFGQGCLVVAAGAPDFRDVLRRAIHELWTSADLIRPKLLAAAESQCEAGRSAYARLRDLVDGSRSL